jgi:hypothetical protein
MTRPMNEQEQKRIEQLLKQSVTPVGEQTGAELRGDLWPEMLKRLNDDGRPFAVPWFDWALLATVAAWLVFFPGAIPVLFYHL